MSSKRKAEIPSEEKYMQQELQLERELQRMRKEYIVLDHDRESYQLHGIRKLARGNHVFNIFRQEYQNLRTDLHVARTPEKRLQDAKTSEHLQRNLLEYDMYEKAVQAEKMYMVEVEGQIKIVRKSVQELRKDLVTDRLYQERVENARRTCALLENNLDTQIKKFNLVCAKNNRSREQIDHLLWDRRNFMDVWSKVITKLSSGKKIMMDLIEQATIAYDQREDLCNKLQALRLRGHKELYVNIDDMRELKRKMHHFEKLEDFFNTKGRKIRMVDLERKEQEKRNQLKVKLTDQLHSHEQMLEEITTFYAEQDQEKIARKYYNREAQNFMLFKYLNDTLAEMEILGDQLGDFRTEIENSKVTEFNRANQQGATIQALQERLDEATSKRQKSEESLHSLEENLKTMMEMIFHLFKTCRCDQDPLLKLLGDNSTIKDYNVLLYLEILEEAVHDILIRGAYHDRVKHDKGKKPTIQIPEPNVIYPIDKIVTSTPCSLCVEHDMVSDVIDVLQVVWNKDAIKGKIESGLKKSEIQDKVHNTSRCQLPKARQIMQKRYE